MDHETPPTPAPAGDASTPAPAEPAPLTRQEMAEWATEDVMTASGQFLGVLRDITFHTSSEDGFYPGLDLYGLDHVAAEALQVIDRAQAAAATAGTAIREAIGRRDWLTSAGPMCCGNCGTQIEPDLDDWRVCRGQAEHHGEGSLDCHKPDTEIEDSARADTLVEQEYQAYLDQRTMDGPRHGDYVELTQAGWPLIRGLWYVPGPDAPPVVVETWTSDGDYDNGVEYDPSHARIRVTDLGEDCDDYDTTEPVLDDFDDLYPPETD